MSLPFYTERSICWAVPFIFNVVRTRSIAFHNISCRPSYGLYVTKKYTAWIVLNNQNSTTIEWQYGKVSQGMKLHCAQLCGRWLYRFFKMFNSFFENIVKDTHYTISTFYRFRNFFWYHTFKMKSHSKNHMIS